MFRVQAQESFNFHELTNSQFGWDFNVAQLGPSVEVSSTRLYQTPNVGYFSFRYGSAYDQRIHSKGGLLSFGLLDADNPATWLYDQLIPNDSIIVFPRDEELRAGSPSGFRGSGLHFSEAFMEKIAQQVYHRPLNSVIPLAGIFSLKIDKLRGLRAELYKWQHMLAYGADSRPAIISRREESLALAVIHALCDGRYVEKDGLIKSERAVARAMEIIHSSELENISAVELARQSGCSQRLLEKIFVKRFGVTPKKYIKCLRLARVHKGLKNFDAKDCKSIIELAGIHGFWHMGQFAADYRRIYGELPSETLSKW